MHERWQHLRRLIESNAVPDQSWSGAQALCDVGRRTLHTDGAALSIHTSHGQNLAAATDSWTELLEELQYTIGNGPVTEASLHTPVSRRLPESARPQLPALTPAERSLCVAGMVGVMVGWPSPVCA